MPKKKIKPKKKKRAAAKASKPTKEKPTREKPAAQQIDEFDWREVRKIRVGEGTVARQSTIATSLNSLPKGETDAEMSGEQGQPKPKPIKDESDRK